jgi:hypothetical protein
LNDGVQSGRIGYFSFTRKAANEARDRAIAKFPHLNEKTDFPYFRTLHSLAFRCLGAKADDMMQPEHYAEFAQQTGITLDVSKDDEEGYAKADNPILNEINLARIRGVDLREHYNQSGLDIEWHHFEFVERSYRHYKTSRNLLDFTDLLEMAVVDNGRLPKLETVIIDEAQDLSRLQWQLVYALAERSNKMYLAGDDDQCQPGHTKILTNTGEVSLAELDPAIHQLICYDRRSSFVTGLRKGFSFKKARRTYTGKIYTVTTESGHVSSYTDNHHCIVRWKPLEEVIHLRVVYLMQRGTHFRIGQCQLFRADGCIHAWVRAHGEKAEKMWILRVTESIEESTYYENLWSYQFGIPQTCFEAGSSSVLSQELTDNLFNEIPTYSPARKLLQEQGVSFEYPLYQKSVVSSRRGGSQIFEAHAASLLPSAMRIGIKAGKTVHWENFSMVSNEQTCEVYSLDVEKHHNYFADGILTHNCVFTWAGADVKSFLEFKGDIHVLQQSYRVPASVHQFANNIVKRIRNRQSKEWKPRDFIGSVRQYYRFEDVPVGDGEWLILASTNYLLNPIHEWLKSNGVLFERNSVPSLSPQMLKAVIDWERLRKGLTLGLNDTQNVYKYLGPSFVARGHKNFKGDPDVIEYDLPALSSHYGLLTDAIWHEALTRISEDKRQYLRAVLRRGYKISNADRIKLSTIHGAKGGEADNVLLMMDISPKFAKDYATNSDSVNRLFYVGVTRAKQALHLVLPKQQDKGFRL